MGYGDYLMLSGIVRDMKKKFGSVAVTARTAEHADYFQAVFRGNPYLTPASGVPKGKRAIDVPPVRFAANDEPAGRLRWSPSFTAIPGNLYFSEEELRWAARIVDELIAQSGHDMLVLLNPYAKRGSMLNDLVVAYEHHVNKEWGYDRHRAVVRAMSSEVGFVQTCGPGDDRPPIEGALRVETPTFRHAAALLERCQAYLGCEGGMHHAAAAVNTRGVVIFGGWLPPKLTGYPIHDNVYRGDFEDACGSLRPCPHCSDIMTRISVDEIVMRLQAMLEA